jgi:hypothetical protein
MNPTQSNTVQGSRKFNSGESLVGKEGYLVALVDGGSIAELLLPTSVSQLTLFLVDMGMGLDENSDAQPLVTGDERRLIAKGAGSAGDVLVLADPATPADKGKVRAVPATEGAYFSPGVAQEDFANGQFVLVRVLPRMHFVGVAFTGATPAATGATNSSPYGFTTSAQADALVATVRELRAWAIANGFKANNA